MTQPSKLPWKAGGSEKSTATFLLDADGKRVCTMKPCDTDWSNALFIEKAVNSYAALVARVAELEADMLYELGTGKKP